MSLLPAARQRLSRHWGAPVPVTEVLVDHWERAVFATTAPRTDQPLIVKADNDSRRAAVERAAAAAAAAAGVPVAGEHTVVTAPDLTVTAWHRVEAPTLGPDSPDADWRAVGAAVRRLHRVGTVEDVPRFWDDDPGRYPLEQLRSGPASRLLAPGVRDRLSAVVSTGYAVPRPADRLIHGDCAPYHWMVRDGVVAAVIDFGDSGLGDPLWDLVVLTEWNRDRLAAVLTGYRCDATERDRLRRVHGCYLISRHIGALDWLTDHDVDPTPTVEELGRLAATDWSRSPI